MRKRRLLAMSMAAITALTSTSICAFAEGKDSEALAAAIVVAKTRLDIPEELTEFSYNVSSGIRDSYRLTWSTPNTAEEYKYVSVTVVSKVITSYRTENYGWGSFNDEDSRFGKLTGDELYEKAQQQVKKINPTVAKDIAIDRDSLSVRVSNDRATFTLSRTKNGVPVASDEGTLVINKDTGDLISFYINWHEKASFQSPDGVISIDSAKEKYADMIDLKPQYEFYYDWEAKELKSRLVYTQSDYGFINAFTGKKSNFESDGYFSSKDEFENADDTAEAENPSEGGGYDFTEQEKAEIDKDLPYGTEAAIVKMLTDDPFLTYTSDMELTWSHLYKTITNDKTTYLYTVSFTNAKWNEYDEPVYNDIYDGDIAYDTVASEPTDFQSIALTVNAETGELISYSLYDSASTQKDSYDMAKADKLADEIAKKYAGSKLDEYRAAPSASNSWIDGDTKTEWFWGSSHGWNRYANDIIVSGDSINIGFDSNLTLTDYSINYTDVSFADPAKMLTKKQVMNQFWDENDIDLYYLARAGIKVTKTVLVYGTDAEVYVDAFTGESLNNWYFAKTENDLSGIKDKKLLNMAKTLDEYGFIISDKKFSTKDSITAGDLCNLIGGYLDDYEAEAEKPVTRGEALKIYTRSVCGDNIAQLKGIYKSPFTDVKDTDKNVGYYAIAYAMGAVSGSKLNADSPYTYGDAIKLLYNMYNK